MKNDHSVKRLQTLLNKAAVESGAFSPIAVDGIIGRKTEAAVKAFQKLSGLPVTGQADWATWQALERYSGEQPPKHPASLAVALDPNLKIQPGEQSRHLYLMQSMMLVLAGFFDNLPKVCVNGVYDNDTQNAVKILKKAANLNGSEIDPAFYSLLCDVYCSVNGSCA